MVMESFIAGILSATLSPALYGVGNYIDKFLLEKYKIHVNVLPIYTGIFALFASCIILLFTGLQNIDTKTMVTILVSGFFTEMLILPYLKALSLEETSRIIPLFQLSTVIVLLLSFILLGERFILKQYIGSALIISAGIFLSIQKLDTGIFRVRPAFWWMILANIFSALAIILFKFGVSKVDFFTLLPYEGFGIALGAFCVFLYPNNSQLLKKTSKRLPKRVFLYIGFNESIYILSRYAAFFAISLIPVSIVSVLSAIQPFFVLVYGIILSLWFPFILKEILSKKTLIIKILAIGTIFFGMYLIFET